MEREKEKEKARVRRNHKFRIRERGRQYAKHFYGYNEREYCYYGRVFMHPREEASTREEEIKTLVEREAQLAETRPRCSCSMCGNPRRRLFREEEKLTLRERKFLDLMREQQDGA